jgi:hypothetical protein
MNEVLVKSRAAAIAEIDALMREHSISLDELFTLEPAQPAPSRKPAAPPKAAAAAPRVAPARPAPAPPPPKPSPTAARPHLVVETAGTKRTTAPSRAFDPRYQCDPSQPVEGCGFLTEWRTRRTSRTA